MPLVTGTLDADRQMLGEFSAKLVAESRKKRVKTLGNSDMTRYVAI